MSKQYQYYLDEGYEVEELDSCRIWLDEEDCLMTLLKLSNNNKTEYAVVVGFYDEELFIGDDYEKAVAFYDEKMEETE